MIDDSIDDIIDGLDLKDENPYENCKSNSDIDKVNRLLFHYYVANNFEDIFSTEIPDTNGMIELDYKDNTLHPKNMVKKGLYERIML